MFLCLVLVRKCTRTSNALLYYGGEPKFPFYTPLVDGEPKGTVKLSAYDSGNAAKRQPVHPSTKPPPLPLRRDPSCSSHGAEERVSSPHCPKKWQCGGARPPGRA